jgi:ComF family protein
MKPAADFVATEPPAADPAADRRFSGRFSGRISGCFSGRLLRLSSRLISCALPFALPSACAGCGMSGARVICIGCAACLEETCARCARCALPLATSEICGQCISAPPAFDAALCLADYAAPADAFVLGLKFHRRLALAGCLASMLARRVLTTGVALPDLITPVPLSSRRLATRGYNQAWEIARPLARRLHRPAAAHLLRRSRDTRANAELPAAQRYLNIKGAFEVPRAATVQARHIGLVDDVMTSGATLDAAARALKQAGAARVTAFVILRTPKP